MKVKIILLLVFIILSLFLIRTVHLYRVKKDIENNGKVTIAKYISSHRIRKNLWHNFVFYINKKKYFKSLNKAPKRFAENKYRFYKIIYSEIFPGEFQVIFNECITDTSKILAAKFDREDF